MHYNRHRYYDPGTARFTTVDPIGLLGGANNYQYVPNPTGWIDPLGLSCKETDNQSVINPLLVDSKHKKTKEMDSLFNRENEDGYYHPFWGNQTVEYFGEARKLEHELDVVNGKLVHKGGINAGTPFDTKDAFNDNSLDESAIFVMTPEGKMFASKSPERGSIHHSSLALGKTVASAGEIIVHGGKLIEVSNGSGHYEPSQSMNDQLFDELKERGVEDKDLAYTYNRSGFDDKGEEFFDLQQNRSNINPEQIPDDWMDE